MYVYRLCVSAVHRCLQGNFHALLRSRPQLTTRKQTRVHLLHVMIKGESYHVYRFLHTPGVRSHVGIEDGGSFIMFNSESPAAADHACTVGPTNLLLSQIIIFS